MLSQFAYTVVGHSAVFDPATLSLSLWQRDYAGSAPWSGTASAGSSGSRSLVTNGSDPSAGTALNAHGTASFNGTTNTLVSSVNITSLLTNGAGSCGVLFNAASAASDLGANLVYKDPPFLNDGGAGNFNFGFTTSGVRGGYFPGGDWNSIASAAGTSGWHFGQMKWDGSTLKVRVDSGAWVSLLIGSVSSLTATAAQIGTNAFGGSALNATIAELFASQVTLADSDFDNIKSYINSRYSLSL